jgi:hypothetical protein
MQTLLLHTLHHITDLRILTRGNRNRVIVAWNPGSVLKFYDRNLRLPFIRREIVRKDPKLDFLDLTKIVCFVAESINGAINLMPGDTL